jgi:hypothetical protein
MTLESQQVYKIDNKTPKVEKNLFARVNRFDQPTKTWDKMFLKLFWTKVQGRGINFKQYIETDSTDKRQIQLTVFAIAFDCSHKEAENL